MPKVLEVPKVVEVPKVLEVPEITFCKDFNLIDSISFLMDNKAFSILLEKRTKDFAIKIIRLSALLPNTSEGKVIKNQITRSGSSIGANYREANHSRSKADFTSKIKICQGETSETIYWLEIIQELNWLENSMIDVVHKEAKELLHLFSAIGKKLKE